MKALLAESGARLDGQEKEVVRLQAELEKLQASMAQAEAELATKSDQLHEAVSKEDHNALAEERDALHATVGAMKLGHEEKMQEVTMKSVSILAPASWGVLLPSTRRASTVRRSSRRSRARVRPCRRYTS